MSLQGILTIILYSLQPWWWFIALLVLTLLAAQVFHRRALGPISTSVPWVSLVIAGIAMLAAPAITYSKLSYLNIWPDWLALILIGGGVFLYSYLVLSPIWRQLPD